MSPEQIEPEDQVYRKVSMHPERWDVPLNQPKAIALLPSKLKDPVTQKYYHPTRYEDGVSVDVERLIPDMRTYAAALRDRVVRIPVTACADLDIGVVHDPVVEGDAQYALTRPNPAHALLVYEDPRDFERATALAGRCALVAFG